MTGTVSINLFSGLPNPRWRLREADVVRLQQVLMDMPVVAAAGARAGHKLAREAAQMYSVKSADAAIIDVDEADALRADAEVRELAAGDVLKRPLSGFRGFRVAFFAHGSDYVEFQTYDRLILESRTGVLRRDTAEISFEQQLYATAPDTLVFTRLAGMTFAELRTAGGVKTTIAGLKGPDHKLKCKSSPLFIGNTGEWKSRILDNNCYNYATFKLSLPFTANAVPGPGDDLLSKPLTETALKDALGLDKLKDQGSTLPSVCSPAGAHYLVVVLRQDVSGKLRDFHCVRLDRDGTWSHKDGNDEVRNIDDDSLPMTDLTVARFDWSPTLVGIYLAFFGERHLID
jgi:hypothetical protein